MFKNGFIVVSLGSIFISSCSSLTSVSIPKNETMEVVSSMSTCVAKEDKEHTGKEKIEDKLRNCAKEISLEKGKDSKVAVLSINLTDCAIKKYLENSKSDMKSNLTSCVTEIKTY